MEELLDRSSGERGGGQTREECRRGEASHFEGRRAADARTGQVRS